MCARETPAFHSVLRCCRNWRHFLDSFLNLLPFYYTRSASDIFSRLSFRDYGSLRQRFMSSHLTEAFRVIQLLNTLLVFVFCLLQSLTFFAFCFFFPEMFARNFSFCFLESNLCCLSVCLPIACRLNSGDVT